MFIKKSKEIPSNQVVVADKTSIQILIPPNDDNSFITRKITIKQGGSIPLHSNTVEHQQYVLSGNGELNIDGKVKEVSKGSVIFIPEGIPHSYKNTGKNSFEFLCIIPKKEDRMTLIES